MFWRLDRGKERVDHHSFFFYEGPKFHPHHASFETHDFDTQVLGHDWLREKGYRNCWGVGRHILGSQIFDYWCVETSYTHTQSHGFSKAFCLSILVSPLCLYA